MQKVRDLYFPDADTDTREPYLDSGDFEPQVRAFVIDRCSARRRAVDVGAHVGLHAVRLASLFGRLEAFEPQEQVFRALENNLRGLAADAHRVALGETAGIGFISAHAGKNSGTGAIEPERKPNTDPVAVRTLDEFGWDDVDLLKISIGRRADAVLAGALRTLQHSHPVIWISSAADAWSGEVLETALALGRLGYQPVGSLARTLVLAVPATQREVTPSKQPRIVHDETFGARVLWASAAPAGARSARGEAIRLGDAVLTAEAHAYRESIGAGRLVSAPLAARPDLSRPLNLHALGQEAVLATGPDVQLELGALLQCLEARFAAGAVRLSAPPEVLAYFRDLALTVRDDDGERVILRQDLREAPLLDDIAAKLPLGLLDLRPRRFAAHFITETGAGRAVEFDLAVDPAELTPDMLTCYLNRGGGGNPAVQAFARSIGARMAYAEDGVQDGAAFVWGVLRGSKDVTDAVQARDGIFYYMDHAYFARGHMRSYRISRNGFEAGPVRRCPPDRIRKLGVETQPWRKGGRYILVCPPTDYFMQAHDCPTWLEDTLAALKRHTDREVIVRQKPKPGEAVTPLEEAVAGAHALVTHSSNVAVEAVVAGTPVFVASSSAAAPVGRTDLGLIESPAYPDRDMWLSHLAYSQFSFEEIKYGAAWRMLLEWERRELV